MVSNVASNFRVTRYLTNCCMEGERNGTNLYCRVQQKRIIQYWLLVGIGFTDAKIQAQVVLGLGICGFIVSLLKE